MLWEFTLYFLASSYSHRGNRKNTGMLEQKQTLDLLGDVLIVQSREPSPREVWWQLTQPARAVPAPFPWEGLGNETGL